MQPALHITTRVLPGHRIEITAPELSEGAEVEVFLVVRPLASAERPSAMEVIQGLGGRRHFSTPAEVDRHLDEERESWDR